ncbi:MAG: hypothetical protein WCJ18_11625, partial [Planctomycetota bacterium]
MPLTTHTGNGSRQRILPPWSFVVHLAAVVAGTIAGSWMPSAKAVSPISAPAVLQSSPARPRRPADARPPVRSESQSRLFLAGDDGYELWRRTVSTVAAERPIARMKSLDLTVSPPADGLIETSWINTSSDPSGEQLLSRAVVQVTPDDGGVWVDTVMEGRSEIQTVAANWPEQFPAQDRLAQLPPTSVPALPPPWADPILTMPPAYPANSPFGLSLAPRPAALRFVHKLADDYRYFYSCESLVCVTGAVGAAALMANTGFDVTMENAWQTGVAPTS